MTKHKIILRFLALPLLCSLWANAQVGYGTTTPNKAAVVDMQSSSKGFMVPRVALTGTTTFGPIAGDASYNTINANSLLVYNTATVTGATGVSPGYYYWSQTTAADGKWNALATGSAAAANLAGDITGTPGTTYLSKLQGTTVNFTSPAPTNNQAITYQGSSTSWKPLAYTPISVAAQNISAAGSATPVNAPTQNIAFSPTGNATGATVKAISLQVKDGAVTLDKLGSGTATAGQGLFSTGGTNAGMGNVGVKATAGVLGDVITLGFGTNGYTGTNITLGPGKWVIFLGSSAGLTDPDVAVTGGIFLRLLITDTDTSTTTTADRITEMSGPFAGGGLLPYNTRKTFMNGAFAVNNQTAGNKIYYVRLFRDDLNGNTNSNLSAFGSNFWEQHIFAVKIN